MQFTTSSLLISTRSQIRAKSSIPRGAPVPLVIARGRAGGGERRAFHFGKSEMYFVHTRASSGLPGDALRRPRVCSSRRSRDNNTGAFFRHNSSTAGSKRITKGGFTVDRKSVVRARGRDLTIVSYAAIAAQSLEARRSWKKEGIEAEW